jgi:hypothetical protein
LSGVALSDMVEKSKRRYRTANATGTNRKNKDRRTNPFVT